METPPCFEVNSAGDAKDTLLPVIRDMYIEYARILKAGSNQTILEEEVAKKLVNTNLAKPSLVTTAEDLGMTQLDVEKLGPKAEEFYKLVLKYLDLERRKK